MFASVAHLVRLWYCTRRAYRELELLDDGSLEDIGLSPTRCPVPARSSELERVNSGLGHSALVGEARSVTPNPRVRGAADAICRASEDRIPDT